MTAIWDHHTGVAHKLSENYDPELERRLRASLEVIYEAIKDRQEYKDYKVRFTTELHGQSLVEALSGILDTDWDEKATNIIYEFLGGDMHEFDHHLGTESDPLFCQRHRRRGISVNQKFNRNCHGHHTETLLAKMPKTKRDRLLH